MLPVATALVCMILTFCFSESYWLQERIHGLHTDPFTVQRSLDGLRLAETLLPKILAVSLLVFLFGQRNLAVENRWQWQRNYCLGAVLFSTSLVLRLWQCPLAQDDSYIDYRYVLNWLNGQFDYNPGVHIMGFTSHLHLFTLWAVCKLCQTQVVDLASYYLDCAVDAANTILLFILVLKVCGRTLPAFVASMFYAVSTYNCSQVIAGKETALVNLVLLLGLLSLKTDRWAILPWCANALFLFRPEGILACLIMLATVLKAKGRAALKSFILPCGITLAWYGFLLFYFGTVMPHGMIAKQKTLMAGDFYTVFMGAFSAVGNLFTNSTIYCLLPGLDRWPFLITTLAIFIYASLRFKEPCWVLYRNIAVAQILVLMLGHSRVFSWYYCWFTLLVPIVMAQLIADASGAKVGKLAALVLPLRAAICLFAFVYLRSGFFFAPYAWLPYLQRGVAYREAALFLQEKTQGKDVIAASDVGILGYFYHGPILDLMGLVNNESLKYYPIRDKSGEAYSGLEYLIPPAAVSAFKPKYLMAPIGHCQGMLFDDSDFQHNYTELKRWTNPAMTDGMVFIWMRKED
jgi:hypothetical protein